MSNANLCLNPSETSRITTPTAITQLNQQLKALKARLHRWQINWRTRRQLSQLDSYLLKDIGVSLADAQEEASKPFWRD